MKKTILILIQILAIWTPLQLNVGPPEGGSKDVKILLFEHYFFFNSWKITLIIGCSLTILR